MNVGQRIRQLRTKNNLTQEELASRCELTKGYLSQLENDLATPSLPTLQAAPTCPSFSKRTSGRRR